MRDGILSVSSQVRGLTPEQEDSLDRALLDLLESTRATVSEKIWELEPRLGDGDDDDESEQAHDRGMVRADSY